MPRRIVVYAIAAAIYAAVLFFWCCVWAVATTVITDRDFQFTLMVILTLGFGATLVAIASIEKHWPPLVRLNQWAGRQREE